MDIETLKNEWSLYENKIRNYRSIQQKIKEMIDLLEADSDSSGSLPRSSGRGPNFDANSDSSTSLQSSEERSYKRARAGEHRRKLIDFFVSCENKSATASVIAKETKLHHSNLKYNLDDHPKAKETFEVSGEGREREYRLTHDYYLKEKKTLETS